MGRGLLSVFYDLKYLWRGLGVSSLMLRFFPIGVVARDLGEIGRRGNEKGWTKDLQILGIVSRQPDVSCARLVPLCMGNLQSTPYAASIPAYATSGQCAWEVGATSMFHAVLVATAAADVRLTLLKSVLAVSKPRMSLVPVPVTNSAHLSSKLLCAAKALLAAALAVGTAVWKKCEIAKASALVCEA